MNPVLENARALLKDITPLKNDCGRCCGSACCHSMEGEETGMLLFPGEEEFYQNDESFQIRELPFGKLLICSGVCRRDMRPLACRLFPLLPVLREDGIRVVTDERARAVCPIARQGRRAMDPAFTEQVKNVGVCLAADPEQKQWLERLTEENDALKTFRTTLGGG